MISPYKNVAIEWINIGISLFVGLLYFGLGFLVLGAIQAIINRFRYSESFLSKNNFVDVGKSWVITGIAWILTLLVFCNFVHFNQPVTYWTNFGQTILHFILIIIIPILTIGAAILRILFWILLFIGIGGLVLLIISRKYGMIFDKAQNAYQKISNKIK